eukprot:TRINITY_DN2810_c0_g1_i1.p1 TRINITY_DN2810_c0_g1~~TRINITY_DN2810_c0_g1_i1.p1  ORF type:complete len:362 (+),score=72.85 TRINITY_DN2810_c0_g1_i1:271-1356(+)
MASGSDKRVLCLAALENRSPGPEGVGDSEECCGDSADFVRLDPVEPIACNDSLCESLPRMVDSVDTGWTDEMHSSYLDTMEATFVKKMYEKEYCAVDLCGESPREQENQDPDSAESKLSYPSPFEGFKIWQKGNWHSPPCCNRTPKVAFTNVLESPWVQHFRRRLHPQEQGPSMSHMNEPVTIRKGNKASGSKHQFVSNRTKASCAKVHNKLWPYDRQQPNVPSGCSQHRKPHLLENMTHSFAMFAPERNVKDSPSVANPLMQNLSEPQNFHEDVAKGKVTTKRKADDNAGCGSQNDQVVPFLGEVNADKTGVHSYFCNGGLSPNKIDLSVNCTNAMNKSADRLHKPKTLRSAAPEDRNRT